MTQDSTKVFSLLHVYYSVPEHLAFLFLFLLCFVLFSPELIVKILLFSL